MYLLDQVISCSWVCWQVGKALASKIHQLSVVDGTSTCHDLQSCITKISIQAERPPLTLAGKASQRSYNANGLINNRQNNFMET